jgi:hypothetical protein
VLQSLLRLARLPQQATIRIMPPEIINPFTVGPPAGIITTTIIPMEAIALVTMARIRGVPKGRVPIKGITIPSLHLLFATIIGPSTLSARRVLAAWRAGGRINSVMAPLPGKPLAPQ